MHQITDTLNTLTACPDCDLLMPAPQMDEGYFGLCPRCGKTLWKKPADSIAKALALSIAGLLLYLPSMLLPLMTFESFGFSDTANILESIVNFYLNEYYFVSLMVMLSAVIFPFLLLSFMLIISLQLQMRRYPPYLKRLFRIYLHLEEWAMVEVYLLGIMITIIKMVDASEISYHAGIFCFTGLVLTTLAISTVIDNHLFWKLIETRGQHTTKPRKTVTVAQGTGADNHLILCHLCHKLSPADMEGRACPRCGETLHSRLPGAISRTWALVLTSVIFLAPANLLPIMRVDFLGIPDRSTILDGIIYFFQSGSYAIGLIIFTASILVPVFKIVGLMILLLASRPCSAHRLRQKAKMYRYIAFIGRWSMLDIFVIALLTVLVDFGIFTSIHAAPAATYFCIVVASTMFAAITYDPRIMWDNCARLKENRQYLAQ
ncbi:MAG: paraquat-inducible protein A [Desulforhopalus sp.]